MPLLRCLGSLGLKAKIHCCAWAMPNTKFQSQALRRDRIKEFIQLEAESKQITRMISVDGVTIGAVWLELIETRGVKPPSLHIMIGNSDYRGMGIGKIAMLEAIDLAKNKGYKVIYTRHLTNNTEIKKLNDSLGFVDDGDPYTDNNGLTWQHIKLNLED